MSGIHIFFQITIARITIHFSFGSAYIHHTYEEKSMS